MSFGLISIPSWPTREIDTHLVLLRFPAGCWYLFGKGRKKVENKKKNNSLNLWRGLGCSNHPQKNGFKKSKTFQGNVIIVFTVDSRNFIPNPTWLTQLKTYFAFPSFSFKKYYFLRCGVCVCGNAQFWKDCTGHLLSCVCLCVCVRARLSSSNSSVVVLFWFVLMLHPFLLE